MPGSSDSVCESEYVVTLLPLIIAHRDSDIVNSNSTNTHNSHNVAWNSYNSNTTEISDSHNISQRRCTSFITLYSDVLASASSRKPAKAVRRKPGPGQADEAALHGLWPWLEYFKAEAVGSGQIRPVSVASFSSLKISLLKSNERHQGARLCKDKYSLTPKLFARKSLLCL